MQPVWPAFALVLLLDLLAALTEVALTKFVADLIDLLKGLATPATLFADHASLLLWMAFVVLIARPVIFVAYELTKSQVLSPPFQTPGCGGRRIATCCGKASVSSRTTFPGASPIS